MIPTIRKAGDGLNRHFTDATALDCGNRPDLARQEFREDSDTNFLLARYGVEIAGMQRRPQFGEVDFDLDLHSAHISLSRAQNAFHELPYELRQKYGNPARMLDAMNSRELQKDLEEIRDREKAEAEKASADPTPEPEAP